MGYSIYIGNGELKPIDEEYEHTTQYCRIIKGKEVFYDIEVDEVHHLDAPVFANDESSNNSNGRHPSYSAWSDFCDETGLSDLFFNNQVGLMREHPGFHMLTSNHGRVISDALTQWKDSHPNAIPGFEVFSWGDDDVAEVGYDPTLARLIWLEYWATWALENCENAGIRNY